ncbi:MAG: hypothetical protein A3F11_10090 [Gammaproteobacteria bacterium RIFCSPHIGHO2_12_FULL_37_14]|nr:MAG: hypothetical protein A3F11_10090 [Gammaproteobacteria bacterium RIFCSPHIGHO2_12_FULL_37_14]
MSLNRSLSYKYNQAFTFDWNDYRTIKPNENQLSEITSFLGKSTTVEEAFKTDEKYELAWLCYKIGTFYNHIKRNPDLALPQLKIAEQILSDEGLAWTQNHLAFTYQQKLAAAKRQNKIEAMEEYSTKALEYCEKAKSIYQSTCPCSNTLRQIKIVAFAHCVQALTEYEMGKLNDALANYRLGLDLYEKNNALDDQYARAKNRFAMMLAENNQTKEAQLAFGELEKYWDEKSDTLNPYPARFYISYGDFLVKRNADNLAPALDKYKKAYEILRITDGQEAEFTKDIHKKFLDIEEKFQKEKKSSYSPTMYRANNTTSTSGNTIVEKKEIKRPDVF